MIKRLYNLARKQGYDSLESTIFVGAPLLTGALTGMAPIACAVALSDFAEHPYCSIAGIAASAVVAPVAGYIGAFVGIMLSPTLVIMSRMYKTSRKNREENLESKL